MGRRLMANDYVEGMVLKNYGGFYYVQNTEENIYECKLRGKIKQQVLTGDKVLFTPLDDSRGILEKILARRNELLRPRIANVDLLLIVMANDKPAPSLRLLDSLLINAYYYKLIPYIILNKSDLPEDSRATLIKQYYCRVGFNVLQTSVISNRGIDLLRNIINHSVTVMAGPSGSGKSSLSNCLIKGAGIKTQEVSNKIGRGKHTTRHVELFPLLTGGWVADTPGFSVVNISNIDSSKLADYYPDFQEYKKNCQYSNCMHYREKECAVKQAVDNGLIAKFRYDNYVTMIEELNKNKRCYS